MSPNTDCYTANPVHYTYTLHPDTPAPLHLHLPAGCGNNPHGTPPTHDTQGGSSSKGGLAELCSWRGLEKKINKKHVITRVTDNPAESCFLGLAPAAERATNCLLFQASDFFGNTGTQFSSANHKTELSAFWCVFEASVIFKVRGQAFNFN